MFPHIGDGTRSDPAKDRFGWMLEESKKLAAEINVPAETIIDIYKAGSDWEFILKVDALLEAAVRKIVKVAMSAGRLDIQDVHEFVDGLSMRGRGSLLKLLKASGCATDELNLIDCVRRLRNGFAHDITQVNLPLIEVIKRRGDKSELIRSLCYIADYVEADLIKQYEKEGGLLRFGIMNGAMTFLILAYHAFQSEMEGTSERKF